MEKAELAVPRLFPRLSLRSVLYGLCICVIFALIFFNPFTQANFVFALRNDPDMRFLRGVDTSIAALLYFAFVGVLLGSLRQWIWRWLWQRFALLVAVPIAWATMSAGTITSVYIGLRLFNPALACMLESCQSSFVFKYALATFGLGAILAYKPPFKQEASPDEPEPERPTNGCSDSKIFVIFLLMVGLFLLGSALLTLLVAFANRSSSGC